MKVAVIALLSLSLFFGGAAILHASLNEVFTFGVGEFKVSMLSEMQRDRDTEILVGASEEDIAKYVPTGEFPFAMTAFLIQSPDGAYMVDTGMGNEIPRHLASLGVEMGDIKTVFITHAHGDHTGGLLADGSPAFPNAKIILPKLEYDSSEQMHEILAHYAGNYETITPGALETGGLEVAPGIFAIEAYGHTPGHTMYMVVSGGEKLLIWGDLTHAMAIQMPRPGVTVSFDSDGAAAGATRERVLKFVSDNKIPVAGMHVAYPGIGDIIPDPDSPGGYEFVPK